MGTYEPFVHDSQVSDDEVLIVFHALVCDCVDPTL